MTTNDSKAVWILVVVCIQDFYLKKCLMKFIFIKEANCGTSPAGVVSTYCTWQGQMERMSLPLWLGAEHRLASLFVSPGTQGTTVVSLCAGGG